MPVGIIQSEVDSRLKKLARTVKMDGFRPGQGADDRRGPALRLLGALRGHERQGRRGLLPGRQRGQAARGRPAAHHREGRVARRPAGLRRGVRGVSRTSRSATWPLPRSRSSAPKWATPPSTRPSRSCASSAAPSPSAPQDAAAQDGDRVTVDFEGKIDGEPFEGGKAEDFQFLVGEGQMLKEFEDAVRGMKVGDSQDLPAGLPGRLPRQGRGRQAGRLHGHREEDRGRAPARSQRSARQVAGHRRRHGRGPARRHQEEPRARSQVPPAGPQQDTP